MKIFIKNMSCPHCKNVVENEMENAGIPFKTIESNEIEIKGRISNGQLLNLQRALIPFGLAMILDKKGLLVEKIKKLVTILVQDSNNNMKVDLSSYLLKKTKAKYGYLNKIFKEETGDTIDNYYISMKIEKMNMFLQSGGLKLLNHSGMIMSGRKVRFFHHLNKAS